jgi:hypothetical protein
VVLPEDVGKSFGAVFPCEDLVAHGGECREVRRFVMDEFGRKFRAISIMRCMRVRSADFPQISQRAPIDF